MPVLARFAVAEFAWGFFWQPRHSGVVAVAAPPSSAELVQLGVLCGKREVVVVLDCQIHTLTRPQGVESSW